MQPKEVDIYTELRLRVKRGLANLVILLDEPALERLEEIRQETIGYLEIDLDEII